MNLMPASFLTNRPAYRPHLDQLAALFREMDQTYSAVADQYGFRCSGCTDNCCLTRFYHHTLIEYLYLWEGTQKLASGIRQTVFEKAQMAVTQMSAADHRNEPLRIMCPLNRNGQCIIYPHRPMICRLHGIPHELQRPDGQVIKNPGCDAFFDQCRASGQADYIRFDRTPVYRQMTMLEKQLRQRMGVAEKIKLTIAQMLSTISESDHENH